MAVTARRFNTELQHARRQTPESVSDTCPVGVDERTGRPVDKRRGGNSPRRSRMKLESPLFLVALLRPEARTRLRSMSCVRCYYQNGMSKRQDANFVNRTTRCAQHCCQQSASICGATSMECVRPFFGPTGSDFLVLIDTIHPSESIVVHFSLK